jgi:Lactonase, 7-bladed beta-propeller
MNDPAQQLQGQASRLTRREFLPFLGGVTLAAAAPRSVAAAPGGQPGKPTSAEARFVYVGTYTAPGIPPGGTKPSTAVGIYVFELDPQHGGLTPVEVVQMSNPSFLALDPTLTHLYCTNENDAPDGAVSAFTIAQATGTLSFLNTQSTNGAFPAHLRYIPPASICSRRIMAPLPIRATIRSIRSSPTARSACRPTTSTSTATVPAPTPAVRKRLTPTRSSPTSTRTTYSASTWVPTGSSRGTSTWAQARSLSTRCPSDRSRPAPVRATWPSTRADSSRTSSTSWSRRKVHRWSMGFLARTAREGRRR